MFDRIVSSTTHNCIINRLWSRKRTHTKLWTLKSPICHEHLKFVAEIYPQAGFAVFSNPKSVTLRCTANYSDSSSIDSVKEHAEPRDCSIKNYSTVLFTKGGWQSLSKIEHSNGVHDVRIFCVRLNNLRGSIQNVTKQINYVNSLESHDNQNKFYRRQFNVLQKNFLFSLIWSHKTDFREASFISKILAKRCMTLSL